MNLHRPLSLALGLVLAASTFGLVAGPVDPAVAPEATVVEDAVPKTAAEAEAEHRCLKHTGTHIDRDDAPGADAAAKADADDKRNCAIAHGTAYTREDLERTGRGSVREALQALDPRVY